MCDVAAGQAVCSSVLDRLVRCEKDGNPTVHAMFGAMCSLPLDV